VLVAARSPAVVNLPRSRSPPAVAATLPPAVVVPRSRSPPAVAVTLPPTVLLVPSVRSPPEPAVATRLPEVFILPRVRSFLSAMATEPLMGIGCGGDVFGMVAGIGLPLESNPVTVAALTVPPKSLLGPLSVIAPGAVIFNDVSPALATVVSGA
jgi:hypothetical protein